jgi:hypothetical protein
MSVKLLATRMAFTEASLMLGFLAVRAPFPAHVRSYVVFDETSGLHQQS